MGLFRRDDDTPESGGTTASAADPPHRALESLNTLAAAPLQEAASAIMLLAFAVDEPGDACLTSQITLRAQDVLAPATGLSGTKLLMHFQNMGLQTVINESVEVLQRSLLVYALRPDAEMIVLTRRGRRALDSGVLERWMDVPADPV
jgi:hypothetical protein